MAESRELVLLENDMQHGEIVAMYQGLHPTVDTNKLKVTLKKILLQEPKCVKGKCLKFGISLLLNQLCEAKKC